MESSEQHMQIFVLGCKPNTLQQTSCYHPLEITLMSLNCFTQTVQYVSDENVVIKC